MPAKVSEKILRQVNIFSWEYNVENFYKFFIYRIIFSNFDMTCTFLY